MEAATSPGVKSSKLEVKVRRMCKQTEKAGGCREIRDKLTKTHSSNFIKSKDERKKKCQRIRVRSGGKADFKGPTVCKIHVTNVF